MMWLHFDHLGEEQVRHPRAQRAFRVAGKAAVQVAPVRQVAGAVDEAEQVHHRHQHQGAVQPVQHLQRAQPADDLHAVQLVAVNGGAHQQHRPVRRPHMTSTGMSSGVWV
jgi:hypothetical protein